MTKTYKCIKSFPGVKEWTVFSLDEGLYKMEWRDQGYRPVLVENNSEYFKLVEEKQEGKLWRAEHSHPYYSISCTGIDLSDDWFNCLDDLNYNLWNYYRTEEDAQAVLDYQLLKTKMEDKHGYIDWNYDENHCDHYFVSQILSREEWEEYSVIYERYIKAQKNRFIITD